MEGNRSCGHPKKCWLDAIKDDLRWWNLQAETHLNCSECREQFKTTSHTHAGHVTQH